MLDYGCGTCQQVEEKHTLEQRLAEFFCKEAIQSLLKLLISATVELNRQFINKCAQLCVNKTLFTKRVGGPGFA